MRRGDSSPTRNRASAGRDGALQQATGSRRTRLRRLPPTGIAAEHAFERTNERTNQTLERRAPPGAAHGEQRLRRRARAPTSGATRRGECTHTRNPGTQQPGRRNAPVECRLHNDRELSCKDEGRLEGSLRPESRPPALSASNDMLSSARALLGSINQVNQTYLV